MWAGDNFGEPLTFLVINTMGLNEIPQIDYMYGEKKRSPGLRFGEL